MINTDVTFIRMSEKKFDSIRFVETEIRFDSIRPIFKKSLFDSIRFDHKKFNSVRFDSDTKKFNSKSIRIGWDESNRIELFAYSIRFRSLIPY